MRYFSREFKFKKNSASQKTTKFFVKPADVEKNSA